MQHISLVFVLIVSAASETALHGQDTNKLH